MPAIDCIGGARVVIYLNDHRPAHVHVLQGDCHAVLVLRCPDGPPEIRHILEEILISTIVVL